MAAQREIVLLEEARSTVVGRASSVTVPAMAKAIATRATIAKLGGAKVLLSAIAEVAVLWLSLDLLQGDLLEEVHWGRPWRQLEVSRAKLVEGRLLFGHTEQGVSKQPLADPVVWLLEVFLQQKPILYKAFRVASLDMVLIVHVCHEKCPFFGVLERPHICWAQHSSLASDGRPKIGQGPKVCIGGDLSHSKQSSMLGRVGQHPALFAG
mmetsp:Transcript_64153/g.153208  ORF Transcript_64153/g.153208 Transcript_64153/m.153208 type:complete len:209 (+) Transcript_64153:913-1539(+)